MNLKTITRVLISSLIFLIILKFLNIKILYGILKKINLGWIFIAILIAFLANLISVLKLKLILDKSDRKISFLKIFWYYFLGILLSQITPAKTGFFLSHIF